MIIGALCISFRIPYHRDVILKMLLKLVSDLCPEDDHIPEKSGWCVCVCACACACACACVCACVRAHAHVCVRVYKCMHVCAI